MTTPRQAFATGTTVAPEKTRAEIETTLNRYGATGFAYAVQDQTEGGKRARIEFIAKERRVRFDLTMPPRTDKRFTRHPKYDWQHRTEALAIAAHEAEVRRLWRALLLAIKAKLEVVQSGLAIFEEEFLANIVMPDGRTVGEHAMPAIAQSYRTGQAIALLPAARGDIVDAERS